VADKLRIFEVISNLIRNAIHFSSKIGKEGGRTITITTGKKADSSQAIVSVRDQGLGISPNMLPRLFTRFSTDKESGGTGLGLFIAKNIVEAHGGRIWAENNKDGEGATFTFTLPLAVTAKSDS
jgi:signal transduction histidine kinase